MMKSKNKFKKIMPCCFSKEVKKWSIKKNPTTYTLSVLKNARHNVFGFLIIDHF